ncbi:hypothetical protein [Streptomyces echinatus]|uniref:hypothetical protein n=1 Tax=Streptomyces echinatus TaxID=67293 RepID=UPI0038022F41
MRFLVLGLALPALLCATACAGPGTLRRPAGPDASPRPARPSAASEGAPRPASPTTAPAAASAADLCARIVAHWSREALDGGTYGDYQSMGLSNGQYDILRDVVDAARPVRRRQGTAAANRLIDRQARAGCAARYRHGTPSAGPWS